MAINAAGEALAEALEGLIDLDGDQLLQQRRDKFLKIGRVI
jgi:acetyl-CoA carboxylase alpha subunit